MSTFNLIALSLVLTLFVPGAEQARSQKNTSAEPEDLLHVQGKVTDGKSGEVIDAHLEYYKLPDSDKVGIYNTESGTFDLLMSGNAAYELEVVAQGYIPYQESLALYDHAGKEMVKNIELVPLKKGDVLRLDNLLFEQDEFYITESSYRELDRLVRMMEVNPTLEIRLEGHTDIRGNPRRNYQLSKNRIMEVGRYLQERGIDKNRLEFKAFGGSEPLVREGSLEQRAANRRVEVRIMKI
ncbi:OmpA family protein [Catalinimonas alkaloidigena]|uniref:OmpA family protein n=1 Tax=Catalinimonas alkaloidigena TaxID=1075417 RepID=A0A1G9DL39_9BACT|nr:OmpA family protein [Catalinimonas alkaloidigena]SDK64530.1 OmpA family protein [Catalinimonas alkaloidigena]